MEKSGSNVFRFEQPSERRLAHHLDWIETLDTLCKQVNGQVDARLAEIGVPFVAEVTIAREIPGDEQHSIEFLVTLVDPTNDKQFIGTFRLPLLEYQNADSKLTALNAEALRALCETQQSATR